MDDNPLFSTPSAPKDPAQPQCMKCGRPLTSDEIGIHKKMINRGAEQFFCLSCLSAYTGISEESIRAKIEHFRRQGCLLFR